MYKLMQCKTVPFSTLVHRLCGGGWGGGGGGGWMEGW